MDTRKLATIAIPLAVGGLIWLAFTRLNKPASQAPAATASDATGTAPQDTTHEKAALEEQLKSKPGHPPILLRLAEIERQAGNIPAAVTYLQTAVKTDPGNEDALLELGLGLFETGDVQGALKVTESLVKQHPESVDGLYNLGALHANLGHKEQAKEYWTKAAQLDPASDSGKRAMQSLPQLDNLSPAAAHSGSPGSSVNPVDVMLRNK